MNFTQIKETCIYAVNLDKMLDFYHNLLELPIISNVRNKHIFFRAGSSVLLCFNSEDSRNKKSPPAHFAEGKPHFALEVRSEEYEQTKSTLQSKGITITAKVIWENGQESFYFEDPAGNVLEIVPCGIWN
jgi:catechol 2,3-dioxygenase-like lactoylglutathione lyase family enzyme